MTLRITTWNVNGIRNPFSYSPWSTDKRFDAMFDLLGADIVCLQETKIQKKDLRDDMVLVPGWDSYFTFPRYKKGYSGVAVYTRNSKCQPIKAEEGITGVLESVAAPGLTYRELPEDASIGGYPDIPEKEAQLLDSEGRALVLDFGAFVLIGTYCPAATDEARDDFRIAFVQAVDQRVRNLVARGRRVVVVGDLNIARDEIDAAGAKERMRDAGLEDWKDTPTRKIMHRLCVPHEDGVLVDLCREFFPDRRGMYTCWDVKKNCRPGNFGSRIDYVLVSTDMKSWFTEANIQEGLMGSDHCPVFATIAAKVTTPESESVHVVDLVNPPGTFVSGERQPSVPYPSKPRLCAKTFSEYSGRQSIKDMFSRMKKVPASTPPSAPPASTSPAIHTSSSPKNAVADSTPPPAKRQKTTPASLQRKTTTPAAGQKKTAPLPGQRSLNAFFKPRSPPMEKASHNANVAPPAASQETTVSSTASQQEALETPTKVPENVEDGTVHDPIVAKESWGKLFTAPRPPKCEHGEECIQMTTKKPGANCGRAFWVCPRPLGPGGTEASKGPKNEWRCNFFLWKSDWNAGGG